MRPPRSGFLVAKGAPRSHDDLDVEAPESEDPAASAVILFGIVHRSLRYVVDSLRTRVIAPLARLGEVDVFFHCWDVRQLVNPRAKEVAVAVDPSEVERWLPEARGKFESQDAFDETIDWAPMLARNPMRNHTRDEDSAQATLKNLRRGLESAERAWAFFRASKQRSYRRVVVARPDVRFQNELTVPPALIGPPLSDGRRRLWVPQFHAWGGVNDRFAIGDQDVVSTWCHRTAFADGWLLGAENQNPEWLLMKWLARNRIRPEPLDLVFQRIRGNGLVDERDAHLTPFVTGSASCD
jgi:hypothetical protein